ncbi:hypothetical protein MKW92_043544 [Papaver armeniacum]|nr:hypothetical protein MKW92_043544 [Papaver armeniacum]
MGLCLEWRNLSRMLPIGLVIMMVLTISVVEARVRFYKLELKYEFQLPDCFKKLVIATNGTKTPGPSITAQLGDTLIFELKNTFLAENVSIHWHGIRQIGNGSTWSDGTEGLPQCPPGKTSFYKFVVDRPRIHLYYDAHNSMQREAGLYGPVRVPVPKQASLHDDYGISIILNDWCHEGKQTTGSASKPIVWVAEPKLVKMKGNYNIPITYNGTKPECAPYVITVVRGETFRLKISSFTSLSAQNFEIEGHNIAVMEANGHLLVESFIVGILSIYPGETYSISVKADQDPSKNYSVNSNVVGRKPATPTRLAIINYYPNPDHTPSAFRSWNDFCNFLRSSHLGRNSFILLLLFYLPEYIRWESFYSCRY